MRWGLAAAAVAAVLAAGAGAALGAGSPSGKLYPSRRCGECHGRQREEWSRSAHALAATGAFEKAAASVPAAQRAGCDACHVPLEEGGPRAAADGVGCDACHTATAAADGGHGLVLSPELATRFGPFRDSKDHHFHRVAFSPFVTSDALCIACHEGGEARDGGVRPYTTATEWLGVKERKTCAACHLPAFKAIAAKGEKERRVAHHDFGADSPARLAGALLLKVEATKATASVELSNTGAHHALPSGRPEQALRLEVRFLDRAGAELPEPSKRRLGRELLDDKGAPATGFTAVREGRDGRLFPGRPFKERFPAPTNATRVQVRLWYEPFGEGEPQLVMETSKALGER